MARETQNPPLTKTKYICFSDIRKGDSAYWPLNAEAVLAKSIYTQQYDVFQELLRRTREAQGITQVQMSKRLKIHQSRVSNIEMGERRMDVVELRAWCEALGVTLESFMAKLVALWRKQGLYRTGARR